MAKQRRHVSRLVGFNSRRNSHRVRKAQARPNHVTFERLEPRKLLVGTGTVVGHVFNDLNYNGQWETNEPHLNRRVYADLNLNGELDTNEPRAFANSQGQFQINNVPVGNVTIRQALPAGWESSVGLDGYPVFDAYAISDNGNIVGVDAHNGEATVLFNSGLIQADSIEFGPDGQLFVVANQNHLYRVNLDTQVVEPIALPPDFAPPDWIEGLAFDGTKFYASASFAEEPTADTLISINLTTNSMTYIGQFGNGIIDVDGLAYGPDGYLYGSNIVDNRLVRIDPNTGAATLISTLPEFIVGLDFDHSGNLLGVFGDDRGFGQSHFMRIDQDSGDTEDVGELGAESLMGLASRPRRVPDPGKVVIVVENQQTNAGDFGQFMISDLDEMGGGGDPDGSGGNNGGTGGGGEGSGGGGASVSISVSPRIIFEPGDQLTTTDPTSATFTVSRQGDVDSVTLQFVGTATINADFTTSLSGNQITFGSEDSVSFSVSALSDNIADAGESIRYQITGTSPQAEKKPGSATVDIADDDSDPDDPGGDPNKKPKVWIIPGSAGFEEGSKRGTFIVHRELGDFAQPLSVGVSILPGPEATHAKLVDPNADFTWQGGNSYTTSVTIPANKASTEVRFDVIDDQLDEIDSEKIDMQINPSTSYDIPWKKNRATNFVYDNEDGDTPYIVIEKDETNDEGKGLVFQVRLSRKPKPGEEISVKWESVFYGSAAHNDVKISPATPKEKITFATNETLKHIGFELVDDDKYEDDETFKVQLLEPVGAELKPEFSVRVGTIIDNEPEFEVMATGFSIQEPHSGMPNATANFTIGLSGPWPDDEDEVEIKYRIIPQTATPGRDYTADQQGTVIITEAEYLGGTTTKQIEVEILADAILEFDESTQIVVTGAKGKNGNDPKKGTATAVGEIFDNGDAAPHLSVQPVSLIEGQVKKMYGWLSQPAEIPLSFVYSAEPGTAGLDDFTPNSGAMTFWPGQTNSSILVDGILDDLDEQTETYTVSFEIPDVLSAGGQPDFGATVSISDKEPPPNNGVSELISFGAVDLFAVERAGPNSELNPRDIAAFVISRGEVDPSNPITPQNLNVNFSIQTGIESATYGVDYVLALDRDGTQPVSGNQVLLPASQRRIYVYVIPLADGIVEWDECVELQLEDSTDFDEFDNPSYVFEESDEPIFVSIFDTDGIITWSSNNVDTESTSLVPNMISDGNVVIDVTSGSTTLNLPLPDGFQHSTRGIDPDFFVDSLLPADFIGSYYSSTDPQTVFRFGTPISANEKIGSGRLDFAVRIDSFPRTRTLLGGIESYHASKPDAQGPARDDELGRFWRFAEVDRVVPFDGSTTTKLTSLIYYGLDYADYFTENPDGTLEIPEPTPTTGLAVRSGLALLRGDGTSSSYFGEMIDEQISVSDLELDPTEDPDPNKNWRAGQGYWYTSNPDATAEWETDEELNGAFQIYVNWVPDLVRGEARYTISGVQRIDNSGRSLEVDVNQRYMAGDSFQGEDWLSLGWFVKSPGTGPVKVTLQMHPDNNDGPIVTGQVLIVASRDFHTPDGSVNSLEQRAIGLSVHDYSSTDSDFVLRQKDSSQYLFDKAGLLVAHFDRNQNQTRFSYVDADGDGYATEISNILHQGGRYTSIAYANGFIDSITEHLDSASLTTEITVVDGMVTMIELPDTGFDIAPESATTGTSVMPVYEFLEKPGGTIVIEKISVNDSRVWLVGHHNSYYQLGHAEEWNSDPIPAPYDGWWPWLDGPFPYGPGDWSPGSYNYSKGAFVSYVESDDLVIASISASGQWHWNGDWARIAPDGVFVDGVNSWAGRATSWVSTGGGVYWANEWLGSGWWDGWWYGAGSGYWSSSWWELSTALQTDRFGLPLYEYRPSSTSVELSGIWSIARNEHGQTTQITSPAGGRGQLTNPIGPQFEVLDELISSFAYDANANLISLTAPDQGTQSWEFDLSDGTNSLLWHLDALSNRVEIDEKDAYGNPLSTTEIGHQTGPFGTEGPDRVTNRSYTSAPSSIFSIPGGLVQTETKAFGTADAVTTQTNYFEQGPVGLIEWIKQAYGTVDEYLTSYEYDDFEHVVAVLTPKAGGGQVETNYVFDSLGRLITEILPPSITGERARSHLSYDGAGNNIVTVDALGRETQRRFDALHHAIETFLPFVSYNNGQGMSQDVGSSYEINLFAGLLPVLSINASGEVERLSYDWQGRLDFQYIGDLTNSNPKWKTFEHDVLGNQIAETRFNHHYDANDPDSYLRVMGYDAAGRLTEVVTPPAPGNSESMYSRTGYDLEGKVVSQRTETGDVTQYFLDSFDRIYKTVENQEINGTKFAYDLRDNLTAIGRHSITMPVSFVTETREYDFLDRLVQIEGADPGFGQQRLFTGYDYDDAGNLVTTTTHPIGLPSEARQTNRSYDELGRVLTEVSPSPEGTLPPVKRFHYDLVGNLLQTDLEIYVPAPITGLPVLAKTYSTNVEFDQLNRPWLERGLRKESGARSEKMTLYDLNGRVSDTKELMVYVGYSGLYKSEHFEYDRLGNLVLSTATATDGTSVSSSRTYDWDGRLLTETDEQGAVTRYEYDIHGLLLHKLLPLPPLDWMYGQAVDQSVWSYTYTALGLPFESFKNGTYIGGEFTQGPDLVERKEYDWRNRLWRTTLENDDQISREYDENNNLVKLTNPGNEFSTYKFDNLNRVYEEYVSDRTNPRRMTYDAYGSILTFTDRRGVVQTNDYDSAGFLQSQSWSNDQSYSKQYDYTPWGAVSQLTDGTDTDTNSKFSYEYDNTLQTRILQREFFAGGTTTPLITLQSKYKRSFSGLWANEELWFEANEIPGGNLSEIATTNYSFTSFGTNLEVWQSGPLVKSIDVDYLPSEQSPFLNGETKFTIVDAQENTQNFWRTYEYHPNGQLKAEFFQRTDGLDIANLLRRQFSYDNLGHQSKIQHLYWSESANDWEEAFSERVQFHVEDFDRPTTSIAVGAAPFGRGLSNFTGVPVTWDEEGNVTQERSYLELANEPSKVFKYGTRFGLLDDSNPSVPRIPDGHFVITFAKSPEIEQLLTAPDDLRLAIWKEGYVYDEIIATVNWTQWTEKDDIGMMIAFDTFATHEVDDLTFQIEVFQNGSWVAAENVTWLKNYTFQFETTISTYQWGRSNLFTGIDRDYRFYDGENWIWKSEEIQLNYDAFDQLMKVTRTTDGPVPVTQSQWQFTDNGRRLATFEGTSGILLGINLYDAMGSLLAVQMIGTPGNPLIPDKTIAVVNKQEGSAEFLWIDGLAHERVKFTTAGLPSSTHAGEIRHLASLFTGFDFDESSELYFGGGRPYSASTQAFLNEDVELLASGATNLYQRSSDAPVGTLRPDFFGINYFATNLNAAKEWKELGHRTLDFLGAIDPFGVFDLANAAWYTVEGNYTFAGISLVGAFVPYVGDTLKVGKAAIGATVKSGVKAGVAEGVIAAKAQVKAIVSESVKGASTFFAKGVSTKAVANGFYRGVRDGAAAGLAGAGLGGGIGLASAAYNGTNVWAGGLQGAKSGAIDGFLGGFAHGYLRGRVDPREGEIVDDAIRAGGKYDVGQYSALREIAERGLDAHHVGQKAVMRDLVPGYDQATAPSILVPKVGHTIRGPQGIVSRSTSAFTSARQVIARDIRELRRVYPDIPNEQLQQVIELNKSLYPVVRKRP